MEKRGVGGHESCYERFEGFFLSAQANWIM
jgi:hypothetical protein